MPDRSEISVHSSFRYGQNHRTEISVRGGRSTFYRADYTELQKKLLERFLLGSVRKSCIDFKRILYVGFV